MSCFGNPSHFFGYNQRTTCSIPQPLRCRTALAVLGVRSRWRFLEMQFFCNVIPSSSFYEGSPISFSWCTIPVRTNPISSSSRPICSKPIGSECLDNGTGLRPGSFDLAESNTSYVCLRVEFLICVVPSFFAFSGSPFGSDMFEPLVCEGEPSEDVQTDFTRFSYGSSKANVRCPFGWFQKESKPTHSVFATNPK